VCQAVAWSAGLPAVLTTPRHPGLLLRMIEHSISAGGRAFTILSSFLLVLSAVFSCGNGGSPVYLTDVTDLSVPEDLTVDEVEPRTPVQIRYRAADGQFQVDAGTGYEPLYLTGINLGVAVPGTFPGELAASSDQYERWLHRINELGFNTIRCYTLHYPRFYAALASYNSEHPDAPLYLLQGIWLDDTGPELDLFDTTMNFETSIKRTIDAIHGQVVIESRFGAAYGEYDVDVSSWVVGFLPGREVLPGEVDSTDSIHALVTAFDGVFLSIAKATPTAAWITARMDTVLFYEHAKYNVSRPVGFSSWPTLDPITHLTEPLPPSSYEDFVSVDLAGIDATAAEAGVFAAYHIYPYYPDFLNDDPAYSTYEDASGVNNFLGYLLDLRSHYGDIPLVVAEFGIPSSWGNAHYSVSGMHHGGHSESAQVEHNLRMWDSIEAAGLAGGVQFAWIDEWFKRTWITNGRDLPHGRQHLWHNVTSPEQNFGLIAFSPPEPDFSNWQPEAGSGRILLVEKDADQAFFHLRILLSELPAEGEVLQIGFDTIGDDVGESVLPFGQTTEYRHEFVLVLEPPGNAELYVMEAYDLHGLWNEEYPNQSGHRSIASDGGAWVLVSWLNHGGHYTADDETWHPPTIHDIGLLSTRYPGQAKSSLDAVSIDQERISIRLPWTLLQVTDPSQRLVMDDLPGTTDWELTVTPGIRVTVNLSDVELGTERYGWAVWDEVINVIEREKNGIEKLRDRLSRNDR
jgi:hypothetical protein